MSWARVIRAQYFNTSDVLEVDLLLPKWWLNGREEVCSPQLDLPWIEILQHRAVRVWSGNEKHQQLVPTGMKL